MSDLPLTPSMRLDGRRALITGAGRGIGFAAAAALAEAGAHVTLCDKDEAEVTAAVASLIAAGRAAEALVADVTDVEAMGREIADREAFDVFVNNAGTNRPAAFTDVRIVDFDAVMALNVRGSFFAAQAVARRLIAAGKPGSIINISSTMGHVGMASRSLYCATKWAVEGYARCMAIELAPLGIRVNNLAPTFVETPLTKPFFENPAFLAAVMPKIKLGRLGKVEDLMGAILFLAGDASALMTGTSLLVDGGWTAE